MTLAYIPITLTNNESTATATSFQQLLQNINMRDYFQFLNPDLSNTYFSSDSAGSTVINSWIESGNTNISTDTTFWVVTSIAANSTITIYLQVDLSGTNHLNTTTTGVAPQLTSTYAEYDNGANIFPFYNNFAGTTLPSSFATSDASGMSVNNGVSISAGAVYTTSAVFTSLDSIEEMYAKYTSLNGVGFVGMMQSNTQAPQSSNAGSNAEILWMTGPSSNTYYSWAADGVSASYNIQSNVESSFTPSLNVPYIIGSFVSSSEVGETVNYTTSLSASGTFNTQQYIILGYFTGSSAAATADNPIFVQWVRTRAYPPSGVMPSVSLGTPSGFPYVNTTSSVTEVLDF